MIVNVFIDLDGPIIDVKERHYQCYRDIITEGSGTPLEIDQYWVLKRIRTDRRKILELSRYRQTYEIFSSEWLRRIELDEYLKFDKLKLGARKTLIAWSSCCSLYLVTLRQSLSSLSEQLRKLDIFELFAGIICCDFKSEHPKYARIKKIAISGNVFIGDTEEDMLTANMLNIPSIAITNGIRERRFLKANYYYEEITNIPPSILFTR
jgi:phosphoglycolate phosphatase-like HAD superfamily hydrolase